MCFPLDHLYPRILSRLQKAQIDVQSEIDLRKKRMEDREKRLNELESQ